MTQSFTINLAQSLVAWLHLFVALAGVAITGAYLKRSRRTWLVFGAFLLQVLNDLTARLVFPHLITNSGADLQRVTIYYFATSIVSLAAYVGLVLGVAGILSELPRPTPVVRQDSLR